MSYLPNEHAQNSTLKSVVVTALSAQILAANDKRKGAVIFSLSGTILISLGTTNSAILFTARITSNDSYEVPFGYIGVIYANGSGTILVTELT